MDYKQNQIKSLQHFVQSRTGLEIDRLGLSELYKLTGLTDKDLEKDSALLVDRLVPFSLDICPIALQEIESKL